MTTSELARQIGRDLAQLRGFLIKTAVITLAALVVLLYASHLVDSFIESRAEQLAFLKGGPTSWKDMERKLYDLANAPDVPEDKKDQIVRALRKLSAKYRPYVEAISTPRP